MEKHAMEERAKAQQELRELYPDKIARNQEEQCRRCARFDGKCVYNLLPVTSAGGDCPYFIPI